MTDKAPPRAALLLRPDTMGDLVLFSPALRRLREGWPGTRLAVVIRGPYLDLARLLAPEVSWIPTEIDPFATGPREAETELNSLLGAVRDFSPDLVVAACLRRHWLDTAVAAAEPAARRVAFGSSEEDPFFGVQVRHRLGASREAGFWETAPAAAGEQDWRRNFGLVDYLLGRTVEPVEPSLGVAPELLDRADGIIRKLGLEPGSFVACAAAGFANVRIKTWQAERYAGIVQWLRRDRGVRTLLIGQDDEQDYLEALRNSADGAQAAVWTGGAGDLPLLSAILCRSAFFVGNDTGAMHLASAVGRPVVAVFGGGTWPRFQPAARRAISLLHPLPCFGCGWDCPFGDAPCVLAVDSEDVQKAISDILDRPGLEGGEIRAMRNLPEPVIDFMGKTAALARRRAKAHLAREQKLEEIAFLAGEKDGEIKALKAAADEKDAEILEKDAENVSLKRATDEKDAEIVSLKRATDERDAEIEAKDAEIQKKHAEIAALARACEERLQLIIRMDADLKRYVQEVARLQAEVSKMTIDPPRNLN
jgi:ADP-heptose:LPS heptosyltransferase